MEIQKKYVKPISIEGTKKILDQMENCICKIKNNEIVGTGFFCRISYQNNYKINVLITSYQIIDDYYLNQNNKIELLINGNNQSKTINLEPNRKIYSTKKFNTTIIEIKDSDNINNYLEIDNNLFRNDLKDYYEFQSIYILQYIFSGTASVSYGILNELNGFNINHMCFAESGSNGAPILNLTNNKVIGISLMSKANNNYNIGTILKYPIEEFINIYNNQNQQINNLMNNNNFRGINNNIFIPNMMFNNFQNFQNPNMIRDNNNINFFPNNNFQNSNMIINNNNNFIPNINMNNNFPNSNMMMGSFNQENKKKPRVNALFKTSTGVNVNVSVEYGTTMKQLLSKYLEIRGRPDLINNHDKIVFIYNANKIQFTDITPVEKYFNLQEHPTIVVNDVQNLLRFPKNN